MYCASIVCSAQTIELRSDRSAKAEIKEDKAKQNYAVKINFVPVTTLDDVTNEEMTVMLAQFFIEEALSIFLKDSKLNFFSKVPKEEQERLERTINIKAWKGLKK